VIHLPPLPGAPRFGGDMPHVLGRVRADAEVLARAGFDVAMVENFGDVPFFPGSVAPVTVAAMTACALAARDSAPKLSLGINVLRNDVASALSIARVVGATCVRVNVHTSASVTDQGIVEGRAAETLRLRESLGASRVAIWADVDVKHAAPLARRDIGDEAKEVHERALADAVLVTGGATGALAAQADLEAVRTAVPDCPIYVASGAKIGDLSALARLVDGVIVGSALRKNGVAGGPIDAERARKFADAFRASFR
jgi:membrane complex biogenesis BtpA family protein